MAMGLAVTWCDTPRRLMGRAALHQQGPNEVRHRFSPRDHDNVKVLQHAICETTVAGHHLLSWWRVWTSQASNLQTTLGWLWKNQASISSIDLLLTMKKTPHPLHPHVVWPNTHRTTRLRWETQEATLSNIVHWDMFLLLQVWRQSCARTQSMFYGEGFWLMMGGKLQKGCSGIWFTGSSLHCNEE